MELVTMIIECCSNEKTFIKCAAAPGERLGSAGPPGCLAACWPALPR